MQKVYFTLRAPKLLSPPELVPSPASSVEPTRLSHKTYTTNFDFNSRKSLCLFLWTEVLHQAQEPYLQHVTRSVSTPLQVAARKYPRWLAFKTQLEESMGAGQSVNCYEPETDRLNMISLRFVIRCACKR